MGRLKIWRNMEMGIFSFRIIVNMLGNFRMGKLWGKDSILLMINLLLRVIGLMENFRKVLIWVRYKVMMRGARGIYWRKQVRKVWKIYLTTELVIGAREKEVKLKRNWDSLILQLILSHRWESLFLNCDLFHLYIDNLSIFILSNTIYHQYIMHYFYLLLFLGLFAPVDPMFLFSFYFSFYLSAFSLDFSSSLICFKNYASFGITSKLSSRSSRGCGSSKSIQS